MQIIGGQTANFNPGVTPTVVIKTGVAQVGGTVILHNLSPYDTILTFLDSETATDKTRQAILHAWQPREFDFCGKQTAVIHAQKAYDPPPTVIDSAPSSFIWGEAFAPGEVMPKASPNYDRLSNVGNTVNTRQGSDILQNDGNPPGTPIIEATPSDQTASSWNFNNDASGLMQILSAGLLRIVFEFIRGDAGTTEAVIQIGDPADVGMTTLYGTATNATQAGQATVASVATVAQSEQMFDGGLATINSVNHYEGTVDPSTYLIPSYGDIWYNG